MGTSKLVARMVSKTNHNSTTQNSKVEAKDKEGYRNKMGTDKTNWQKPKKGLACRNK